MRRVGLILIAVGIAVVSLLIGRRCGRTAAEVKAIRDEMKRVDQFAELDRTVLQTFPARTNAMVSGTYLMQVWFPRSQLGTQEVVLRCENGHITVPAPNRFNRSGSAQT